jgi:PAS domain S-box-containing protein
MLIVEDSAADAEMMVHALRRDGFEPKWIRVETEPDFLMALRHPPEVILSDYSMPQFSGLRAADLLHERGLHIPFILVSGTIGEEIAVEAMKHGSSDYLLKDRIARLGGAVRRALEQQRLYEENQRAAAALKLFRTQVDLSSDGIELIDPVTGHFLDVNETTCQRLGYTREELLTLRVPDVDVGGSNYLDWDRHIEELRYTGFKIFEGRHRRKDGSTFPVEANVRYVRLERDYLVSSVRDITERKLADEAFEGQLSELQRWHEVMLGREERNVQLKNEVNELLARLNEPPRYQEHL